VRLELQLHALRLASPLHTAYGVIAERPLVLIALHGREGVSGHGEAAPLQPYDGVSAERVCAALQRHGAVLESVPELQPGREREQIARAVQACRGADPLPAALAAIDMALWDRAARARDVPLARLLSERPAEAVPVNATLTARGRAALAEQAAGAVEQGFGCVKLKVGLDDDAGRVAAVRAAAGPGVQLRLDANGAWSVAQAARAIAALATARPELIEEPVHGLSALRQLRALVDARVAIDETADEEGALAAGVAHAVCLKISRCGGVGGTLAAAATVRASGAVPYLASTLDGPLGIAAALHAAAAISASGAIPHCGLATLALFEGLADPLPVAGGQIALPRAAGLGVEALWR
jgi:L-alanine-DL-glutamate epimerase-like enolase superfamily enzyme